MNLKQLQVLSAALTQYVENTDEDENSDDRLADLPVAQALLDDVNDQIMAILEVE